MEMAFRIAIVEDDGRDAEVLERCLEQYGRERNLTFELARFKDGEDLVWFYGKEDLLEKAKWYFTHDYDRERIAANGLEKVRDHNYVKRINRMLETVNL